VERTIVQGDMLAAHCRVTGSHLGVEFWGICIARIHDGKVTEAWNSLDFLGLYQQIGLVPPMPE
jgi:hypothetical protein